MLICMLPSLQNQELPFWLFILAGKAKMNDSEHIYFSASKAIEYIHLRLSENRLPPFENQVKAFEKTDHLIEHMRYRLAGTLREQKRQHIH